MASIKKILKAAVRRGANAMGYDIIGYDGQNPRTRLNRLLAQHHISLILDVGANYGDFGWNMRELGYRGRIMSFEPVREAFSGLKRTVQGDPLWQAMNLGLGDRDEQRTINVAGNSQSSSLLPMLSTHEQSAPESRYEKEELVTIRRLDSILSDCRRPGDQIFLKIDTQGYERNVLNGAHDTLDFTPMVQLECSLVPLYDGADLIEDIIHTMRDLGYDPIDALPTFYHRYNTHLMQTDILFLKRAMYT